LPASLPPLLFTPARHYLKPMPKPCGMQSGLRWYWWLALAATAGLIMLLNLVRLVLGVIIAVVWLVTNPKVQIWFWVNGIHRELRQPNADPPAAPAHAPVTLATNAAALRTAPDLFRAINVWDAHLKFTSNQWAALEPKSVPPIRDFLKPDGSATLRNPAAIRPGLAGVLGIDLPWSAGELEFGGLRFTNVAARFKGNGTFLGAVRSHKRSFKLDLNQEAPGQRLAGRSTLNFHNLVADPSNLHDALACEFFREAGVPAPRTAFARLRLTVGGRFENRLLGLYLLVENPDAAWAREQFGVDGVALFKPVTYELFANLGDDWAAYAPVYDPKTKTTAAQQGRLIALAKFFSAAGETQFAAEIGKFIDLPEFASFLACQALLANYDSILSNGQNFLLYLDPRTDRFGFIPWDHDHCWGQFPFIGTADERAHASVREPWVGPDRFLARMVAVPAVRQLYEAELKRLRETLFVPERLSRRLDELAAVVRPFIAEESTERLGKFESVTGNPRTNALSGQKAAGAERPGLPLKEFFATRAESVSAQLAGQSEGVILKRKSPW